MCTILKAWKAGSNFLGTHKKVELKWIIVQSLGGQSEINPEIHYSIRNDWIRHSDGKLSFLGFVRLLHGVPHEHFRRLETTNYSD
ncbi:unnamed protein product [Coffea canephora]|uniref:Uncharacterized protein n=1 Tax=Coffea canephora TaxID=49390 RepID=A0A068UMB5_COFCA|nr:unnamed protein product [Coffea canephora]